MPILTLDQLQNSPAARLLDLLKQGEVVVQNGLARFRLTKMGADELTEDEFRAKLDCARQEAAEGKLYSKRPGETWEQLLDRVSV